MRIPILWITALSTRNEVDCHTSHINIIWEAAAVCIVDCIIMTRSILILSWCTSSSPEGTYFSAESVFYSAVYHVNKSTIDGAVLERVFRHEYSLLVA